MPTSGLLFFRFQIPEFDFHIQTARCKLQRIVSQIQIGNISPISALIPDFFTGFGIPELQRVPSLLAGLWKSASGLATNRDDPFAFI